MGCVPDPREAERIVCVEIEDLAPAPVISDHAVLRYLERAYGLDVEAVRAEMMVGVPAAIDFGARVVICHGVRLIIRDGRTVVTVLPKRKGRGRAQHMSTKAGEF